MSHSGRKGASQNLPVRPPPDPTRCAAMITPRIKSSSFFPEEEAVGDLFLGRQRKAKLEGYVQTLAAIDALVDFTAMAAAVDAACPRSPEFDTNLCKSLIRIG